MNRLVKALFAVVALAALCGCGPPNTSRAEMNPRKEKIYRYVQTLAEADLESSVMGSGIGPSHPARLKAPYPTRSEMEAAIGQADFSQTETVSDLHPLSGEGPMLTLYWWEKDSTWRIPGLDKKGYREIIIARFDREGRLRMVEVLFPVGYELVGRHSLEWHRIG